MNEERDELRQIVQDIMGYPFYVNSIEVSVLGDNINSICDSIIDAVRDKLCDECEYSCNESNCDRRHNC